MTCNKINHTSITNLTITELSTVFIDIIIWSRLHISPLTKPNGQVVTPHEESTRGRESHKPWRLLLFLIVERGKKASSARASFSLPRAEALSSIPEATLSASRFAALRSDADQVGTSPPVWVMPARIAETDSFVWARSATVGRRGERGREGRPTLEEVRRISGATRGWRGGGALMLPQPQQRHTKHHQDKKKVHEYGYAHSTRQRMKKQIIQYEKRIRSQQDFNAVLARTTQFLTKASRSPENFQKKFGQQTQGLFP